MLRYRNDLLEYILAIDYVDVRIPIYNHALAQVLSSFFVGRDDDVAVGALGDVPFRVLLDKHFDKIVTRGAHRNSDVHTSQLRLVLAFFGHASFIIG